MKCTNCGGELILNNGVGVCSSCGISQTIEHIFENIEVYLCYVENDAQGRRTKDSIIASDIYKKLETKKVNVFYERISAANATGNDLITLRYSAISKAKIVLVIGTQTQYFEKLLATYHDCFENKKIVPVYSEMRPESLPRDIRKLQALNYDAIGSDVDLVEGVFNLLGRAQELDAEKRKAKAHKNKIIIGVASLCSLLVFATVGLVLFINQDPKENVQPQLTLQEIYDTAQALMDEGKYIEAVTMFQTISDFKNSKTFIKNIYGKYDGYYRSEDSQILFRINIQNGETVKIFLERSVEGNKKVKLEESTTLTSNEFELSFVDSLSNSGKIKIILRDDGISITTSMDTKETISIGEFELDLSLDQRTDAPEDNEITTDTIISWMKKKTTLTELIQRGYEVEFVSISTAGGGTNDHIKKYKIANTDIDLVLMDFDFTEDVDFSNVSWHPLDDYVVYAVLAPAELIAPQDIGKSGSVYQKSEILYCPGTKRIRTSDYSLFFETGITEIEPIQKDTLVGITSKFLIGEYKYNQLYYSQMKEAVLNSIKIDFAKRENVDNTYENTAGGPQYFTEKVIGDKILLSAFMWDQPIISFYSANVKTQEFRLIKKIDVGYNIKTSAALDVWKRDPEIFGEFLPEDSQLDDAEY